jgi:hypothetical protein
VLEVALGPVLAEAVFLEIAAGLGLVLGPVAPRLQLRLPVGEVAPGAELAVAVQVVFAKFGFFAFEIFFVRAGRGVAISRLTFLHIIIN